MQLGMNSHMAAMPLLAQPWPTCAASLPQAPKAPRRHSISSTPRPISQPTDHHEFLPYGRTEYRDGNTVRRVSEVGGLAEVMRGGRELSPSGLESLQELKLVDAFVDGSKQAFYQRFSEMYLSAPPPAHPSPHHPPSSNASENWPTATTDADSQVHASSESTLYPSHPQRDRSSSSSQYSTNSSLSSTSRGASYSTAASSASSFSVPGASSYFPPAPYTQCVQSYSPRGYPVWTEEPEDEDRMSSAPAVELTSFRDVLWSDSKPDERTDVSMDVGDFCRGYTGRGYGESLRRELAREDDDEERPAAAGLVVATSPRGTRTALRSPAVMLDVARATRSQGSGRPRGLSTETYFSDADVNPFALPFSAFATSDARPDVTAAAALLSFLPRAVAHNPTLSIDDDADTDVEIDIESSSPKRPSAASQPFGRPRLLHVSSESSTHSRKRPAPPCFSPTPSSPPPSPLFDSGSPSSSSYQLPTTAVPNKRRRRPPPPSFNQGKHPCMFVLPSEDGLGELCLVAFSRPADLSRHKESVHGVVDWRPRRKRGSIGGMGEGDGAGDEEEWEMQEGRRENLKAAKAWFCEGCGGEFSRKDALRRHGNSKGHATGV